MDTSVWSVINRGGDAGNHEAQCYVPGNAGESGGNMVITSKVDPSCAGHRYTSGMVQWTTATFTYGTIEVRAKQSGGQGSWPAQWLLGATCQVTNITTAANGGGCNSGPSGFQTCAETVSAADQNWHVYALTRTSTSVTWSVDGRPTCAQRAVVPTGPMFLIINNAMGGDGGGRIDAGDFPQTMLVDYVRVKKT